ncbi:hypothetical protein Agub_g2887, partial [Astrephomene gubernaculifera]
FRRRRRLMQDPAAAEAAAPPPQAADPSAPSAGTPPTDTAPKIKTCSVLLRYAAGIGDPTAASDLPIFTAYWAAMSTSPQVPVITSWVLGWTFNAGERISYSKDVFETGTPAVTSAPTPLAAGAATTPASEAPAVLESVMLQDHKDGNTSALSSPLQDVAVMGNGSLVYGSAIRFNLIVRKGPPASPSSPRSSDPIVSSFTGPASAPLRATAPENVFFNNMKCESLEDLYRISPRDPREARAAIAALLGGGAANAG